METPLADEDSDDIISGPSRAVIHGDGKHLEKTSFREMTDHIQKAYGWQSYGTWVTSFDGNRQQLTDYDPYKLASSRVLTVTKGTVLLDAVLLIEQVIITLIFMFFAGLPMGINFAGYHYGGKHTYDLFIATQESKMRSFAAIMSGLAAFLLSFLTSLLVGRWWVIRTQGVGGIKAAGVDLEMLVSQSVTMDEKVLSAIRRYARASLMLIFLWRRGELDCLKEEMVSQRKVLTEDEVDQLLEWNHCWHETIWAWQAVIINTLEAEGKIKHPQLYCMLLDKCCQGRAAAQCVHTYLAVRIPMQYVHLLGFLVKGHNIILAIIMGVLFGNAFLAREYIVCAQTFGRTFLLPFLFNAILLINARLSDPFDGHSANFPAAVYEHTLDKDCISIVKASTALPDWLSERRSKLEGANV